MANHSGWRNRQAAGPQGGMRQTAARPFRAAPGRPAGPAAYTEPEVRRWPHPVTGAEVPPAAGCAPLPGQLDAALYYIHCALSYQNQLLADITALLEQLAADRSGPSAPAAGDGEPPAGAPGGSAEK